MTDSDEKRLTFLKNVFVCLPDLQSGESIQTLKIKSELMKKIFTVVLIALLGLSCTHKNWEADERGVTVFPERSESQARAVRMIPMGEEIIQEKKDGGKSFESIEVDGVKGYITGQSGRFFVGRC